MTHRNVWQKKDLKKERVEKFISHFLPLYFQFDFLCFEEFLSKKHSRFSCVLQYATTVKVSLSFDLLNAFNAALDFCRQKFFYVLKTFYIYDKPWIYKIYSGL